MPEMFRGRNLVKEIVAVIFSVCFASIAYYFNSGSFFARIPLSLTTALGTLFLSHVMLARRDLENLSSSVERLRGLIEDDERIIFSRRTPEANGTEVLGVNVATFSPKPLPTPTEKGVHESDRWKLSVSLLVYGQFQDLLLSAEYLRHYAALAERSEKQVRILVIRDRLRSGATVPAFLTLSKGLGVKTYLYTKAEFFAAVEGIGKVRSRRTPKKRVEEILQGNPELNVCVDSLSEFDPVGMRGRGGDGYFPTKGAFLLRYLPPGAKDLVEIVPGKEEDQLVGKCLARVLEAAQLSTRDVERDPHLVRRLTNRGTSVTSRCPWNEDRVRDAVKRCV